LSKLSLLGLFPEGNVDIVDRYTFEWQMQAFRCNLLITKY
jgi:hypothetical protein